MIGLTSLWIDRRALVSPELNRRRALVVLGKIDEILSWEQAKEHERDERFVELGEYLCEVRAGQYWRLENLKSFDDFLEKRFPESRRKAYYLMAIHEHLTADSRRNTFAKWAGARPPSSSKLARRDEICRVRLCNLVAQGQGAAQGGLHERAVECHLTGQETEPWEIIYFKLYKSQLPVVERALETAALMLGSDKSRGYCLEMICADFLAGAALEARGSEPGIGVPDGDSLGRFGAEGFDGDRAK